MRVLLAFLLALPLNAFASGSTSGSGSSPSRVIAYFPAWSETSAPEDMPVDQLTHLVYAFMHVSDDGECELLPDIGDAQKILTEFKKLKSSHPRLKTTLAIGGANYSENFPKAARTDAARKKFVSSCMKTVDQYGFDGVDLDWEYPTTKPQFEMLVKLTSEFRAELGKVREVSVAVPGGVEASDYPIAELAANVNWFGVMAYDRCDDESKETCHHALFSAPLTRAKRLADSDEGNDSLTGDEAVKLYLDGGARPDQVVFGLPFYGYKWKVPSLDSGDNHGIGQAARGKGVEVSYREIREKYLGHKGYEFAYDLKAQAPVIWNDSTNEVISFDNETSLAFKRERISKLGLGGVMIWDITEDDDQSTLLSAVLGH